MECESACHERKKSSSVQRPFVTLAETKSDSQAESLINVAEFKANFMGKLYYY